MEQMGGAKRDFRCWDLNMVLLIIFDDTWWMGSMPKGKVLHQQRVIRRIFSAAEAAKYPVEQIEFTADGKIIVT